MEQNKKENEFIIKIEYEKSSERPERIFSAMSNIIEAFHEFDKCLALSFSVDVKPMLVLQDIESGSIRTKLASVLKGIDDDALKDLDWKKQIGKYLVKGKHKVIEFLEEKESITSIEPVKELEGQLLELAKETDIQVMPFYTAVPTQRFLESIAGLSHATNNLSENDQVTMISEEGEISINKKFYISSQVIEELLTKHIVNQQSEMILLVKKPDYLGYSMWDVQLGGKTVQAKILDVDWLNQFHNQDIDLRPGDSLRALVHIEIKYGDRNTIVGEHYTVLKVMEIIKLITSEQKIIE